MPENPVRLSTEINVDKQTERVDLSRCGDLGPLVLG